MESTQVLRRVLIVDDNKDFADAVALTLRLEGYVARACYDGTDALHQAASFHPQIVILDIHMPKLTGYEAARVFKRHPEATRPRLIALTGMTGEAAQVRAQMAGFDHYVAKPADSAAIVALVRSIG
jgi:DNA-binding response OmpR family regulator